MAGVLATVDMDHLAGHEAGTFEGKLSVHNVIDVAEPAHRLQRVERPMRVGRVQRRADNAGRDRIDPDAARRCIEAAFGQAYEAGWDGGEWLLHQRRGDLHDMDVLLSQHGCQGTLRHVEEASNVDVEDAVEVVQRVFGERLAKEDASGVDQRVDAAPVLERCRNHALGGCALADRAGNGDTAIVIGRPG